MSESEMRAGVAVEADGGTTFAQWVTEQLGRAWPSDESTQGAGAHGLLDPLLWPTAPRVRPRPRPVERSVQRPVSMVAATAIRDVLASWRAAERELAVAVANSPEWAQINARLISLRVAYHRLFDEASAPR